MLLCGYRCAAVLGGVIGCDAKPLCNSFAQILVDLPPDVQRAVHDCALYPLLHVANDVVDEMILIH